MSTVTDVDVLIVEDDDDCRTLLRCLFEDEGFRVAAVEDGALAVDLLAEVRPGCVVLDVMLPGLDGFQVLDAIRGSDRTWDVPVVLLTSKSSTEPMIDGFESGADEYITKPFHPDSLAASVTKMLSASRVALRRHRLERLQGVRMMAAIEDVADFRG